jgi:gamma-aminobutyric acid type B receptor
MTFCFATLTLTLTLVAMGAEGLKDIPLTIGGIFPMNGSWAGGPACKPAVELALQKVNANPDILPQYKLNMQSNDSQVYLCFYACFV